MALVGIDYSGVLAVRWVWNALESGWFAETGRASRRARSERWQEEFGKDPEEPESTQAQRALL
jgi:hypothetical protein